MEKFKLEKIEKDMSPEDVLEKFNKNFSKKNKHKFKKLKIIK